MGNKYEDLEKVLELKKKGIITEEEFEKEKKRILDNTSHNSVDKENVANKTENKISSTKVVNGLLIFFAVIIVVGVVISIANNPNISKDSTNKNATSQNTTEKPTERTSDIILLDDNKDIVYTSFSKHSNEGSYDIPFINIDSATVKDINTKIQQEYENMNNDPPYWNVRYDYYINNKILSLVIGNTAHTGGTSYSVYNIGINSGKTASNTDLLKSRNMDKTTFLNKLLELYKNKFIEVNGTKENRNMTEDLIEFYEKQYNETISTDNYNMLIPMFLDANGRINVIAKIYNTMAGANSYYYIINADI